MIIGIAGPAGAGKDTVADFLVSHYNFTKLAFAGPLKEMLAAGGFPEPVRELKEAKIEGFDFTWRQAAQQLGTEFGRALDPDIWTKIIDRRIDVLAEQRKRVVISDVRFENEAVLIRKRGGYIIHMVNRRSDLGGAGGHASEAGVRSGPGDASMCNDGTIEDLYRNLKTHMYVRSR